VKFARSLGIEREIELIITGGLCEAQLTSVERFAFPIEGSYNDAFRFDVDLGKVVVLLKLLRFVMHDNIIVHLETVVLLYDFPFAMYRHQRLRIMHVA